MIEISEAAQGYLQELLGKQDETDVAIRIFVAQPGTPNAETCIAYCRPGEEQDGDLPVASVGRVWCYCDASTGGPIAPGDLLTTSGTAGHAMRAVDRSRAFGATIGKAMTSLKRGQGLVLVLVSLQ